MKEGLERKLLVVEVASKIESNIREGIRGTGANLKAADIDPKEASILALDIYQEAIELLKKRVAEKK